jgi:endo-1,4-beta-xylanase
MAIVVLKPSYLNPLQELSTKIIIIQKYIPFTQFQYYLRIRISKTEKVNNGSIILRKECKHMKTQSSNFNSHIFSFIAVLLSIGVIAGCASTPTTPTTLKDAYKDHFYIGVAVNRLITTGEVVQADNANRTMEELTKDIALVKTQFNSIVNENDLKPSLIHPNPGPDGYDFGPADAFVKFGMDNDMYIAGHTLLWHAQVPNWFFEGTASETSEAPVETSATPTAGERRGRGGFGRRRGITGPLATREELIERMRDHIHTVVGRYKGKIKVWDVVNEALADGGGDNILRSTYWTQIIGDDFIAMAFKFAHEADPDAILRYNDYGLENRGKREKLKKLIKQLQDEGAPVHAIGTQTHINVNTSFAAMDQTLTDLESIGLPIHITELDMNAARGGQRGTNANIEGAASRTEGGMVSEADQRQSKAYADLFRALIKHKDSVEVVTFWGANDAVSWLGRARPLLFDGEDNPKPAFDAVMRVAAGE